MKYYTWKLKWDVNPETGGLEGTDPTGLINNDVVYAQPQFATGDLQDPSTLIYVYLLQGEINPEELTDWSVTEITANEMLAAAQELEPEAVLENGLIKYPVRESDTL
jgi:hypothetical protein